MFGLLNESQKKFIEFVKEHSILWADAKKIPLGDETAEIIYSSHMIEHLDKDDCTKFFLEAKRVLKKDGIIRIVVPDTKKIVLNYIEDENIELFLIKLHLTKVQTKTLKDKFKYLIIGDRQHQWMYDEKSLKEILIQNGYRDPEILEPGKTLIPNSGNLDLFERQEESLYMEAKK